MEILSQFLQQLKLVQSVWIPFVLALAVSAFAVWRVLQWRYVAVIDRLKEDVIWIKTQVEREREKAPAVTHVVPEPTKSNAVSSQVTLPATTLSIAAGALSEKTFVPKNMNLERLIDMRRWARSAMDERNLELFHNKWIHFEVTVEKTGYANGQANVSSVVGNPENVQDIFISQVTLWFKGLPPEVTTLRSGDVIAGHGRISDVGLLGLILLDCEIILGEGNHEDGASPTS